MIDLAALPLKQGLDTTLPTDKGCKGTNGFLIFIESGSLAKLFHPSFWNSFHAELEACDLPGNAAIGVGITTSGHDLFHHAFDADVWSLLRGKQGQWVPVGVGQPTMLMDDIVVGGRGD